MRVAIYRGRQGRRCGQTERMGNVFRACPVGGIVDVANEHNECPYGCVCVSVCESVFRFDYDDVDVDVYDCFCRCKML